MGNSFNRSRLQLSRLGAFWVLNTFGDDHCFKTKEDGSDSSFNDGHVAVIHEQLVQLSCQQWGVCVGNVDDEEDEGEKGMPRILVASSRAGQTYKMQSMVKNSGLGAELDITCSNVDGAIGQDA